MDICILFYDVDSGTISTRYLDSHFVFHLNSNVLYGEIINSIKDLYASRIILGMDGHNVNWCVFDKINAEREKHNHAPLFNVGSYCGLHSIHGAFEIGMTPN